MNLGMLPDVSPQEILYSIEEAFVFSSALQVSCKCARQRRVAALAQEAVFDEHVELLIASLDKGFDTFARFW